jgi:tetratricopeptide (TPR) repeat protein
VKRLAVVVIATFAALATVADAQPSAHGPPGKLAGEVTATAREAFEAAVAADDAGKLPEAIRQYQRAMEIDAHPNTAYNLADVERRANQLENAIRDYQKYLELAPKAADRGAVAALIDQLQRTPGLFTITSTEPHGRVYIDGKFVGVAPTRASALAGPHEIDIITPISFGHDVCPMYPGGTRNCEVRVKPRMDGNVIISGPAWMGGLEWTLDGVQLALKGRRQVPPGNYALYVMRKEQQCAPVYMLVQDKPLVYFYVNGTQPDESAGAPCTKLTPLQIFVKFDDAP